MSEECPNCKALIKGIWVEDTKGLFDSGMLYECKNCGKSYVEGPDLSLISLNDDDEENTSYGLSLESQPAEESEKSDKTPFYPAEPKIPHIDEVSPELKEKVENGITVAKGETMEIDLDKSHYRACFKMKINDKKTSKAVTIPKMLCNYLGIEGDSTVKMIDSVDNDGKKIIKMWL